MIIRFTPALPCDHITDSGALCGQPTCCGAIEAGGEGYVIRPICPACAALLDQTAPPTVAATESARATTWPIADSTRVYLMFRGEPWLDVATA
jgi:hypothetical protein